MTRLFVNLKGQGRQAIKRQHLGVTEWPPVAVPSKMTTEPAPRCSQSLSHPPLPNRHPSANRGCDVADVGWDSINFAIGIYQVIKVATFFRRSRHTHTHSPVMSVSKACWVCGHIPTHCSWSSSNTLCMYDMDGGCSMKGSTVYLHGLNINTTEDFSQLSQIGNHVYGCGHVHIHNR